MIRPGDRIGDAVQLDDGAFVLDPDAVNALIAELTGAESLELQRYISEWLIRHFNIRVRIQ